MKRSKILWISGSLVAMLLAIIIGFSISNTPSGFVTKDGPVNIGIILPLSGNAAYYGGVSQRGADLALDRISIEYPDLEIELIYEDSQFLVPEAVSAYNRLSDIENIDAVITGASHISLAIKPLAEEDGILQMAVFSAADSYSSPNDLSFRTNPISSVDAVDLAKFVKDNGYEKVGIMYLQNDFGASYKDAFKNQLVEQDVSAEIVGEESYLLEERDFRTALSKMKELEPDVIFMAGLAIHYGFIMKQAEELNIDSGFLSMWSAEDPLLLTTAGDSANGLVYLYPFDVVSSNLETSEYVEAYREKYGEVPEAYSAQSYEAVRLIALVFSECGKDYDCIRDYLENLNSYESVFGELSFDEYGDVIYDFFPKTVKNGEFAPLE